VADLESIASNTLSRSMVQEDQLRQEVALLGARWRIDGIDLRCELKGATMSKCGEAAAYAATLADEMDHHPRILLEYQGMLLMIHTHDAKGITVTDLVYAAHFERWLRQNGWA
jgi:pterin-4a-carbinolamine dehydratase